MNDRPSHNNQTPRIRVAAIVRQDERILLVQHAKNDKRYWLLPGGGVEFGETLEHALVREVKEEANLDIVVGDLVLVTESIAPNGAKHVVNLVFESQLIGGVLQKGNDPILSDVSFACVAELSSLVLHPPIQTELTDIIRSQPGGKVRYVRDKWA